MWRTSLLLKARRGRARTIKVGMVWHDTGDGALTAQNLALARDIGGHGAWRIERLQPVKPLEWFPAQPAPVLAQAASLDLLEWNLPGAVSELAAFEGRRRSVQLEVAGGPVRLDVLEGTLRGVAQHRTMCRLTLEGDWPTVEASARSLGATMRVSVPRAGLAAQAIAVARGQVTSPRRRGAPIVQPGTTLDDAMAGTIAHLVDVILHWALLVPGSQSPEPIHQMRVAVRRLRSALTVFRRAVGGVQGDIPWQHEMSQQLKHLAKRLGTARDWDVFLTETGAEIGAAFAGDRRIAGLLAQAARRRAAAYAALDALFQSRAWPDFEISLALLPFRRPGAGQPDQPGELQASIRLYAEHALDRRLKHVMALGSQLASLPEDRLHELRKQAKKLRYASEFFARLFPEKSVRKYLQRLEKLQAVLGTVNDRAVAGELMAQIGDGSDRAYARGIVLGYGAGRSATRDGSAERAWVKFARATPYWD